MSRASEVTRIEANVDLDFDWGTGFRLSRDELAALIGRPKMSMLKYIDGGLGLVAVGRDSDAGWLNLAQRGLVRRGVNLDFGIGPFLQKFELLLSTRQWMAELRVNDPRLPVQCSHWFAASANGVAVIHTEVVGKEPKFWFALLKHEDARKLLLFHLDLDQLNSPPQIAKSFDLPLDAYIKLCRELVFDGVKLVDELLEGPAHCKEPHLFLEAIASAQARWMELTVERRTDQTFHCDRVGWGRCGETGTWSFEIDEMERIRFDPLEPEVLKSNISRLIGDLS